MKSNLIIFLLSVIINLVSVFSCKLVYSQEYLQLFNNSIKITENADTSYVEDNTTYISYSEEGEYVSVCGYNRSGELRYFDLSPLYSGYKDQELKSLIWNDVGNLVFYHSISPLGIETFCLLDSLGGITNIKHDSLFFGTSFSYEVTGELNTRCILQGDSVICEEFFLSGELKKEYNSRFLSNVYFGDYFEYYENGNIFTSGSFMNLANTNEYIKEQLINGVLTEQGIKHGEWRCYSPKAKLEAIEQYDMGVLLNKRVRRFGFMLKE